MSSAALAGVLQQCVEKQAAEIGSLTAQRDRAEAALREHIERAARLDMINDAIIATLQNHLTDVMHALDPATRLVFNREVAPAVLRLRDEHALTHDKAVALSAALTATQAELADVKATLAAPPPNTEAASARVELGRQLRSARDVAGMSILDVSHATGIANWRIADIERGSCTTDDRTFAKLADALQLPAHHRVAMALMCAAGRAL